MCLGEASVGSAWAAAPRLRDARCGRWPAAPANLYKFWYTIGMGNPAVVQVHPLSEVRARLSGILARFRLEGAAAEPVAFGSHRKPEAILIPYEASERYEALARQPGQRPIRRAVGAGGTAGCVQP